MSAAVHPSIANKTGQPLSVVALHLPPQGSQRQRVLSGEGRQLDLVFEERTQHLESCHGLCTLCFRQMRQQCHHSVRARLLVMSGSQ
jgi:hypothetical protein